MKYYGIKSPDGWIFYISTDKHAVWRMFFAGHAYKSPLATAIMAYEAIGYKRVALKVEEIGAE